MSLFAVCSGCGTFLGHSNKFDLDALNSEIARYEAEGIEPAHDSIGEIYKMRAYCYAHHLPKYEITRRSLFLLSLFVEDDLAIEERSFGFAGIIGLPIGLVFDTVNYPIQYARTLSVSDEDIKQALLDLKKSEELGFDGLIFPPLMIVPSFEQDLDDLGFTIEQYEKKK